MVDNNEDVAEDYYRRLCMLFIPWRKEEEIMLPFDNFEERWKDYMLNLKNADVGAFEDITLFMEQHQHMKDMQKKLFEKRRQQKEALRDQDVEENAEDELQTFDRVVNAEAHKEALKSMNEDQQRIFQKVTDTIKAQTEDSSVAPIRIFTSGTAGTGKSFLINAIADQLTLDYTDDKTRTTRPAILIVAPTGLAAIQIKGSTIHSMFHLKVHKKRDEDWAPMSLDKLNLKRLVLQNTKLIIIDELSMCGNATFAKIHLRLGEIRPSTSEPFGGINILAFGDLLQLPPVQSRPVFQPLDARTLKRMFQSVAPTLNLWQSFEYAELTKNMRQRDDLVFAEIMGRIRVKASTLKTTPFFKNASSRATPKPIERKNWRNSSSTSRRKTRSSWPCSRPRTKRRSSTRS
ncbi:hypothetical protein L596_021245 [Steinernema carpocapsae]|uniref:ATP-dependent DNA helicase n=1 Tax=Steinernema carpocapsae TaxID=34508 RepID=A0A4U5MXD3_STECR|nr:hypothetical protein L596_021245 [Steinernema carpocapsae]